MRSDALGFFWQDLPPPPKEHVQKPKCVAPDPIWLKPDYLPGLEEASRMDIEIMSHEDLIAAKANKEPLVVDIETFRNYFMIGFRSFVTGKAIFFELCNEGYLYLDIPLIRWILQNFLTIGFNSNKFDIPLITLALTGEPVIKIYEAARAVVEANDFRSDIYVKCDLLPLEINHIDLIEVAPLVASLKIYGARLHTPKLQDLPFSPTAELSKNQRTIIRWYNLNADLTATAFLYKSLQSQIELRTTLSKEIGIDVRSKSDAQIAETVIRCEYKKHTGRNPQRPVVSTGEMYKYETPGFIQFQTPLLNWVKSTIESAEFVIGEDGYPIMPKQIPEIELKINQTCYQMGIGGLHSKEKCQAYFADDEYDLIDRDVVSYYPFIILNLGLFPKKLGPIFLNIYRNIVGRRLEAKRAGNKTVADSLKITINGTFGKLGNKYSVLYSPQLMTQVTLTGQLCLLMLIESLEVAGIPVVSANTDGIVIRCHKDLKTKMDEVVSAWERKTGFETEETRYLALFSRDVNNYIAVKQKYDKKTDTYIKEADSLKSKGAYSNPWNSKKLTSDKLNKNPTGSICNDAVEQFLMHGEPISRTIQNCKDITKFVHVRRAKGGAVKVWSPQHTEYLGKSLRWYYALGMQGAFVYAENGKMIAKTEGARPLMDLPSVLPDDIDFSRYEAETYDILADIGHPLYKRI